MIKAFFSRNKVRFQVVGLLLAGYLFGAVVHPQVTLKVAKTTATQVCNGVFQNYLCSAVALHKTPSLTEVYANVSPKQREELEVHEEGHQIGLMVERRNSMDREIEKAKRKLQNRITVETR